MRATARGVKQFPVDMVANREGRALRVTVVTILEIPGLSQEQYEVAGASLPPGPPAGIRFHSCGPVDGGWRIVDVWDSEESFNAFVDGAFLPAVRIAGGSEPARREVMNAHHAGPVTA
jgi:hypothetical protein